MFVCKQICQLGTEVNSCAGESPWTRKTNMHSGRQGQLLPFWVNAYLLWVHTSLSPKAHNGKAPISICGHLNRETQGDGVGVGGRREQIMTSRGGLQTWESTRMKGLCWNKENTPSLKRAVRHSHIIRVNLRTLEGAAHFPHWHSCIEKSTHGSKGKWKNTTSHF